MAFHENKNCPRCGVSFECKVGNVSECQCNVVRLTEEERRVLSDTYTDCLCAACLVQLQQEARQTSFRKKFTRFLSIFRQR